jgi:hypothetical protein
MLDQFDRLRKRNAFLEQYKKEKMFENGLEEFDDARYVRLLFSWPYTVRMVLIVIPFSATAEELLKEYKACESPDYISYVCFLYILTFAVVPTSSYVGRPRRWRARMKSYTLTPSLPMAHTLLMYFVCRCSAFHGCFIHYIKPCTNAVQVWH